MATHKPHLELAHKIFQERLFAGDRAIDATAGRGHDSLLLAKRILAEEAGHLFCMDIQEEALASTRALLTKELTPSQLARVTFSLGCHSTFPTEESVKLIVYNLGYLPCGDKSITTLTERTLRSVERGLTLLARGGAICLTCYPGHAEGQREEEALIQFASDLPSNLWQVEHTRFLNRLQSPSVLFIKSID